MNNIKNAKIVELYESDLFNNDEDFENEDLKDDYYRGDFWYDCDYILVNGETIFCVEVDGEIIIEDFCNVELSNENIALIERFYSYPFNNDDFEELSTWRQDIEESSKRVNRANLSIKYRGGKGYYYGWWILNN